MRHVFLSYCHQDSDFAQILRDELTRAGLITWKDVDLRAGTHWPTEIDAALRDALAVVVVLSPNAHSSDYVSFEWAFAQGAGIPVVPVLLKGLPDKLHPRLRDLHALDFSNYAVRPWDALVNRLREIDRAERTFTVRVPRDAPPIFQEIAQALDSLDRNQRAAAIATLAEMKERAALDLLAQALKHPAADVRTAATIALAGKRDLRALEGYFEAVRDGRFEEINAAEIRLSSFGDAAIPILIRAATDRQENTWVRVRAAYGLRDFNRDEVLNALRTLLTDPDSGIRTEAVRILGGLDAAKPWLLEKLQDEDDFVVYVALQAMEKWRGTDVTAALIQALKHPSYSVRLEATSRLLDAGDASAVPALLEAIHDENEMVRRSAVRALKAVANETAAPALLDTLKASSRDIRHLVMSVLGKLGGEQVLEALTEWLKSSDAGDRSQAAWALGDLSNVAATPQLLNALNDKDENVRRAAAYALRQIKPESAVPALISFLTDDLEEDSDVLRHVVDALKGIGTREARLAARDWERSRKKT